MITAWECQAGVLAEIDDHVRQAIDRAAIGREDQRRAAGDAHHPKRDDEGRDAQPRHQHTLMYPASAPAPNAPRMAKIQCHSSTPTKYAPATRQSPAPIDGEIKPARGQHQGRTDRMDAIVAVASMMLRMLLTDRKNGEAMLMAIESTARTISDSSRICTRLSKKNCKTPPGRNLGQLGLRHGAVPRMGF